MHMIFRTLGLVVGLCACALASGCASQPIALGSESQGDMEAETRLRSQSATLASLVDQQGWTLSAAPADAARQFFSRLISGGSTDETAADPVASYLETQGAQAALAFHEDLARLTTLAQSVSEAALAVSTSRQALSEQTLSRDLAAAESALGAVRRAEDFFHAVSGRLPEIADAQQATMSLQALADQKTRLADAADALAERRWSAQSNLGLSS